jgi:predicted DNA-binding transcriptional regulator YafY
LAYSQDFKESTEYRMNSSGLADHRNPWNRIFLDGRLFPAAGQFTVEEAVTLLIGTDFIEQRFDYDYRVRAQAARGKIEAILQESVRNETSRVRKAMRLLTSGKQVMPSKEREYLEKIRRAILDERKINFHYTKGLADSEGNRHSVRTVAPYGLVLVQGSWMLLAQCDLRQDIRHFHLSRMTELIDLEDRIEHLLHGRASRWIACGLTRSSTGRIAAMGSWLGSGCDCIGA